MWSHYRLGCRIPGEITQNWEAVYTFTGKLLVFERAK
jgi:hypothetical protein